jgi:hypothetical protein
VLVEVGAADAGGIEERQADFVVGGFVGAVLGVLDDGCAVRASRIRQIEPLVGGDFVLRRFVVAAFDGAEAPVVGGVGV